MPSAKKTPNYNLTQYADNGTDKVSFMGDYNSDMAKVDAALNDNANAITTKADTATTYSKTDVDTKLATKADTATTYSKTDVDTKLSTVDTKLSAKADTATTYSKTDVDTKLSAKADAATTYSKTDIDTPIGDFVEFEGDKAEAVAKRCGFDPATAVRKSYLMLYEDYVAEHPGAPPDMVFTEP